MIPPFDKSTRVIYITVGLMGSGKTFHARQLVSSEPNRWKRINRDDIRLMLHGSAHDYMNRGHEQAVTEVSDAATLAALSAGHDLILDNTHLDSRSRSAVHAIAAEFGNCTVVEKVFAVPLETCLERNALRTGVACVPEDIIRKKAKQYQIKKDGSFANIKDSITEYKGLTIEPIVQDPSLPKAIICDLDGTLCLFNGRGPYDAAKCGTDLPNAAVLNVIQSAYFATPDESDIIFMSGRSTEHRPQTEKWLETHVGSLGIGYSLFMRAEGDTRKDTVVKRELFEKHVSGRFYVRFCLDDRISVVNQWRSLGLVCFQVAPGNF